jgi:hypothetical protein
MKDKDRDGDDPVFDWASRKFGMEPGEIWTTLHDRFNTQPTSIQDPEAFHHDVVELSRKATTKEEFYDMLEQRRKLRLDELNFAYRRATYAFNGRAAGQDWDAERWDQARRVADFRSFDAFILFLMTYVPEEYWERLKQAHAQNRAEREGHDDEPKPRKRPRKVRIDITDLENITRWSESPSPPYIPVPSPQFEIERLGNPDHRGGSMVSATPPPREPSDGSLAGDIGVPNDRPPETGVPDDRRSAQSSPPPVSSRDSSIKADIEVPANRPPSTPQSSPPLASSRQGSIQADMGVPDGRPFSPPQVSSRDRSTQADMGVSDGRTVSPPPAPTHDSATQADMEVPDDRPCSPPLASSPPNFEPGRTRRILRSRSKGKPPSGVTTGRIQKTRKGKGRDQRARVAS